MLVCSAPPQKNPSSSCGRRLAACVIWRRTACSAMFPWPMSWHALGPLGTVAASECFESQKESASVPQYQRSLKCLPMGSTIATPGAGADLIVRLASTAHSLTTPFSLSRRSACRDAQSTANKVVSVSVSLSILSRFARRASVNRLTGGVW